MCKSLKAAYKKTFFFFSRRIACRFLFEANSLFFALKKIKQNNSSIYGVFITCYTEGIFHAHCQKHLNYPENSTKIKLIDNKATEADAGISKEVAPPFNP